MNESQQFIPPSWPRPRPVRDSILQGVTTAVSLILLAYGIIWLGGSAEQQTLNDIRDAARAQACVLVLPVNESGRDEGEVNSRCLVPNGITAGDWDGDGVTELENGP